jgi:hypothetical protein
VEVASVTGVTATRSLTLADPPTREYISAITSITVTNVINSIIAINAITSITAINAISDITGPITARS